MTETTTVKSTKTTKTTTVVSSESHSSEQIVAGASSSRAIFVIFLASVIELIAAARNCDRRDECEEEHGFAVAAGVVSAFVTVLFIAYVRLVGTLSPAVVQLTGIFLLAWWAAGAGVNTFRDPFTFTGNGYFASWLAFGASGYFCYEFVPLVHRLVRNVADKGTATDGDQLTIFVLFLASIIELTAAATLCDKTDDCEDEKGWAVAIGAISVGVSFLFLLLGKVLAPAKIVAALLLAFLWIPGVGVLTFDEPFELTGNGYFAAWTAFFAAMYWAFIETSARVPAVANAANRRGSGVDV